MTDIAAIAARLDEAARTAKATPQLVEPLTLEQAYAVQRASVQRRYARGETRIGLKMGMTSRAKMLQMGIQDVIWGRLTSAMLVEEGGVLDFPAFVHPRVEPEVAFLLGRPLLGRVTPLQASAAVAGIAPALEVIDSRYENFKFSLPDVIADNTSASAFVVGPWSDPQLDISNLGLILKLGGVVKQVGSTAAILGNPIRSLVKAALLASDAGEPLQAGDIVMAGGATAAEALSPGQHVQLSIQKLGIAEFRTSHKVEARCPS